MSSAEEFFQSFNGGQLEIQNLTEGYIYRGEISKIAIDKHQLNTMFNWCAKGIGFPPTKWVKDEKNSHKVSLAEAVASNKKGSLVIDTGPTLKELLIFYPPGESDFDPEKVKGLDTK